MRSIDCTFLAVCLVSGTAWAGDWCPEHERPESQCALCHPELARKGVK